MSTSIYENYYAHVSSVSLENVDNSRVDGGDVYYPGQLYVDIDPDTIEYTVVQALIMQFCCMFFNIPVFMYYHKLKEITRPYILSLIALDMLLGIVTLTSYVVLITSQSATVALISFRVFYITFVFGFGFYLYPSFYLALDRFIVVLFPLKFREYSGSLRVAKFVWFSINLANQVIICVARFMYGRDNLAFKLTGFVSLLFVILVTAATMVLYVIMVIQIVRSNKKMSNSRNTTDRSK